VGAPCCLHTTRETDRTRMAWLWREPAVRQQQKWQRDAWELAQRPGILFDMGGGAPHQGHIRAHNLGPQTRYFGLDLSMSARPHVVADLAQLPLASESVDSIYCNAVLEHVPKPQRAVDEMHRVLKGSGSALVAVPFIYPYHDRVDYYRFTDTALHELFRAFGQVKIVPVGDYVYAAFLFLSGFNFELVKWLSPFLVGVRSLLLLALSWRERRVRHRNGRHVNRDYLRALGRSPVGWHIYCEKRPKEV
jgi:SAM-dependent methyltransferase